MSSERKTAEQIHKEILRLALESQALNLKYTKEFLQLAAASVSCEGPQLIDTSNHVH